jgi:hypothetical protein
MKRRTVQPELPWRWKNSSYSTAKSLDLGIETAVAVLLERGFGKEHVNFITASILERVTFYKPHPKLQPTTRDVASRAGGKIGNRVKCVATFLRSIPPFPPHTHDYCQNYYLAGAFL